MLNTKDNKTVASFQISMEQKVKLWMLEVAFPWHREHIQQDENDHWTSFTDLAQIGHIYVFKYKKIFLNFELYSYTFKLSLTGM